MLSYVEHERSFIASRTDVNFLFRKSPILEQIRSGADE